MAVLLMEDLVSRKWLTEIVPVKETSTQVELAFTAALETEGLLDAVEARHGDGPVDLGAQYKPGYARRVRQRTADDLRLDCEFIALDCLALRPARSTTHRSGLDREPQWPPQGRVPAPCSRSTSRPSCEPTGDHGGGFA